MFDCLKSAFVKAMSGLVYAVEAIQTLEWLWVFVIFIWNIQTWQTYYTCVGLTNTHFVSSFSLSLLPTWCTNLSCTCPTNESSLKLIPCWKFDANWFTWIGCFNHVYVNVVTNLVKCYWCSLGLSVALSTLAIYLLYLIFQNKIYAQMVCKFFNSVPQKCQSGLLSPSLTVDLAFLPLTWILFTFRISPWACCPIPSALLTSFSFFSLPPLLFPVSINLVTHTVDEAFCTNDSVKQQQFYKQGQVTRE